MTFKPPKLPGARKIKLKADQTPLEKVTESKGSSYARKTLGFVCVKFGGGAGGQRAYPDRLHIVSGFTYYIEYKRLGKKATDSQKLKHEEMRRHGAVVYVVDSVPDAIKIHLYHYLGGRNHSPTHPRSLPIYD